MLGAIAAGTSAALAGCSASSDDGGDDSDGPGAAGSDLPQDVDEGVYAEVYHQTIDSVAALEVYGDVAGEGSGFVYEGNYLVTNQHVVDGADQIDVQWTTNEWSDGTIVGEDVHSDLAVVEVDDRPDVAEPLSLSSDEPVVGQEVLALGNPLGFDSSVANGIVSGTNRSLRAPTDFAIPNAIQTDVPVGPGNSGGPLVDLEGEVLGVINSGSDALAFAISAALTERVVPALIEDGEFEHSYVGIRTVPVDRRIATANDLDEPRGVIVAEVVDGGPADGVLQGSEDTVVESGRQLPVGGDVIRAIDGTAIPTGDDLSTYFALETDPGDVVEIEVLRDGETTTETVTIGSRDDY